MKDLHENKNKTLLLLGNLSDIGNIYKPLESRKLINFSRENVKVFCLKTKSCEGNVFYLSCTPVSYWK